MPITSSQHILSETRRPPARRPAQRRAKRLLQWIVVLVAVLALHAPSAFGQLDPGAPWPALGSDVRNSGQSAFGGSAQSWQQTNIRPLLAGPSIAEDGTIYAAAGPDSLYALAPSDGSVQWVFTPDSFEVRTDQPIVGSDGTVYIGGENQDGEGRLYAVNATGNQKWVASAPGLRAVGTPAIAADGTIYAGFASNSVSRSSEVRALDPATGETLWTVDIPTAGSSPTIADDGTVYVASDDSLHAIDPVTESATVIERVGTNLSSPALGADGTIYVTSENDVFAINPTTGERVWSASTDEFGASAPVVGPDGTVYVGTGGEVVDNEFLFAAAVYAFDPADGTRLWRHEDGLGGVVFRPAVGADGTIYATVDGGGRFRLFALDPADGSTRWETFLDPERPAPPTLAADGTVYLGTTEGVLAVRGPVLDVPPFLGFGDVLVNSSVNSTVTVTNSGNADLQISGVNVGGANASAFSVESGGESGTLGPGQTREVVVAFAPLEPGEKSAVLAVETSVDTGIVELAGNAEGTQETPTAQTDPATDVTTNSAVLNGTVNPNGAEATVTFEYFSEESPEAARTVTAQESPLAATDDGARGVSASVSGLDAGTEYTFRVIATNSVGTTTGADQTFTTPAPGLSVTPASLDFGDVGVGTTTDSTATVENTGDADLQVNDVSIGGADAGAFSILSGSGSGTLAPGDTRDVAVEFAPQSTGEKTQTLTIESNAPTAQVPLRGDAVAIDVSTTEVPTVDTELGVTASFSSMDFQPTTGTLFYRPAGRTGPESYQSVPFSRDGEALVAMIPAEAVTLRGVEYYAEFSDGERTLTFPTTSPEANPEIASVSVEQASSQVTLAPRTYRMVSVPVALEEASVRAVLEDDYGSPSSRRWRLLRWDPEAEQYREFPSLDEAFEPGRAFWLIARDGDAFDVENGQSVDASEPQVIPLQPGWNQIANPFAFPVAWADVERGEQVERPVYFNGERYEEEPAQVLGPWQGYFVYNSGSEPTTLSIPPVEAPGASTSATAPSEARAPKATSKKATPRTDYTLHLNARHERLRDRRTVIGFDEAATAGRDTEDAAEPPGVGDHVRLSVMESGERLDASFKPSGQEGQWWNLEVSLALGGEPPSSPREVTVTLGSEQGQLPEGYQRYVFDRDAGRRILLEDRSFSVEVGADRPVRRLRLVLGTPAFAEERSEGAPLEPVRFALEGNAPNPFGNGEGTTIRYRLSRQCHVMLDVYNVLGQRIATLVDAEQKAGSHEVKWKGKGLASGVYFYRLRAGSFTASRKMVLVR